MTQYVSPAEAANITGKSQQYITRLCREGKITATSQVRGSMTYWSIDKHCPRFQSILGKIFSNPSEANGNSSVNNLLFVESEWEYLCTMGVGNIVRDPLGDRSLLEYKRCIRKFFKRYSSVTEESIQGMMMSYLDKTREEGVTSDLYGARKMMFSALLSVARYYKHKGWVDEQYVKRLEAHKPKKFNKTIQRPVYDMPMIEAALTHLSEFNHYKKYDRILNKTLIQTALYTGMRNSEMCNLQISDVDFEGLSLGGEPCIKVVKGKGRKNRIVPLPPDLIRVLKYYLRKRVKTDCPNLFVSDRGDKLDNSMVCQRLSRIGKRLGIRFIPHGLRRTAGTQLAQKGVNLPAIRDILGHTELSMTSIYVTPSTKDVIAAANRV